MVLFEIEGLSHKEIAQIVKCSEGTVRSRLHYAKNELQNYMKDYLAQGFDGYNANEE
jgi:RNA polymerase sigma-70 factor (ECF subfamily)